MGVKLEAFVLVSARCSGVMLAGAGVAGVAYRMTTLAAIQMVSTPDVSENLAAAEGLVAQAAGMGATLVSLPEYFCLMSADDGDRLRIAENPGEGPIQAALGAMARRHGIWLLGGTVPLRREGSARVRNASLMFAPDGVVAAQYDKIHLFAMGTYDEAVVLEAGDTPVCVDAAGLNVGLSVCYDLRFPELFRLLGAKAPLDVICAPSAFTYATGEDHWELLVRARAVENQCHVVAAAQGGRHAGGRRTWGNSMVVDPWGVVLDRVEVGEGVAVGVFDRARVEEIRARLPVLGHRRV